MLSYSAPYCVHAIYDTRVPRDKPFSEKLLQRPNSVSDFNSGVTRGVLFGVETTPVGRIYNKKNHKMCIGTQ